MKLILLILSLALTPLCFAANPSFQSFELSQFGTNSNFIIIRSASKQTNNDWYGMATVNNALRYANELNNVTASSTISAQTAALHALNASPVSCTITSTPFITTASSAAGQIIYLEGAGVTTTVTLQSESVLPGSGMVLNADTRTLTTGDTLALIRTGTDNKWHEIGFSRADTFAPTQFDYSPAPNGYVVIRDGNVQTNTQVFADLESSGAFITRPPGFLVSITQQTNILLTAANSFMLLQSDDTTATNRVLQLEAAIKAGTHLWLQNIDPTGRFILRNVSTTGDGATNFINGDWNPGFMETVKLVYNGTNWAEEGRSYPLNTNTTSSQLVGPLTPRYIPYAVTASQLGDTDIFQAGSGDSGWFANALFHAKGLAFPPGATVLVADDTSLGLNSTQNIISSDNATPANRTFHLTDGYNSAGLDDGFVAILRWTGANAGELPSGDTNLVIGSTWTPVDGDILCLMWDLANAKWREQWRYPSGGGGDTLWTNIAGVYPVGPILTSLNTDSVFQIATNYLADYMGVPSTIMSIGLRAMDIQNVGKTNSQIFSIGDEAFGNGTVMTNCSDIVQLGNYGMNGANIQNCYAIYGLSGFTFQNARLTNCFDFTFLGLDAGYGGKFVGSSYIIAAGDQAGASSIMTNCVNVSAFGREALSSTDIYNSTGMLALGYRAGQGLIGSGFNNVVMIGDNTTVTAANDFTLGNSSHNIKVAGTVSVSKAGALSAPGVSVIGTWITGGSATTTKPYVFIEPTGTTSTGWSTSGTGLGINAASGFTGNLLDLQVAGVSKAKITSAGSLFVGANASVTYENLSFYPDVALGSTGLTPLNTLRGIVFKAASTGIQWTSTDILGTGDTFLIRDAAATVQHGLDSATAVAQVIKGPDGVGTDKIGGNVTLEGGQSTGTGTPGRVKVASSFVSTTAATVNAYTTAVTVGGTLKVDTTTTGNFGAGEDTLITYNVPANQLGVDTDYLEFDVWGSCAANANPKQIKVYYGATVLIDGGAVVLNGVSWKAHGKVVRKTSTTQTASCELTVGGTLLSAVNGTIALTTAPAETLSGAITFKVTGTSTVAPSDNDIVQNGMTLKYYPGQ